MRYEIKFVLDPINLIEFKRWITQTPIFRRSYPRRGIHSVYFDTSEMSSARDNLAGIALRNKYRLRWYSDLGKPRPSSAASPKFEIKSKQGRLGQKFYRIMTTIHARMIDEIDRTLLTNQVCEELESRQWRDLRVPASLLEAALLVEYERDYYVAPGGLRVTVDTEISFGDILSNTHCNKIGHSVLTKAIAEFKFPPRSLHQAAEVMSTLPFYPVRSSKYLMGLSLFGHAIYI